MKPLLCEIYDSLNEDSGLEEDSKLKENAFYVVEIDGKVSSTHLVLLGEVIEELKNNLSNQSDIPIKWVGNDETDFYSDEILYSVYVNDNGDKIPLSEEEKKDLDDGLVELDEESVE